MPKIELTQEELKEFKEFMSEVKAGYNFEQVMPQTDKVLNQFPGINPMGHYSEIDMGFAERNKRCEYALRMRDPLAWISYQDLRGKIEKTDTYKEMKTKMVEICQKVNVIDRAIRLSDNDRFVEYLEEQKEELKNDPALKDYDKFMDAMEHYSGVKFLDASSQHKEVWDMAYFLKEKFGVKSFDSLRHSFHGQAAKFSNPKSIDIEFENFENMANFQRSLNDKNTGKTMEEVAAATPTISEQKNILSTIPSYIEASCDRALSAALPNAKDRADMLFIDGRSVREMMKAEKEFQQKDPTEEEIKKYSNLYVAAALRNGNYVEAFTKDYRGGDKSINYKPVPITAKGEDSIIFKKGGANEIEKITVNFIERFLALIGIKYFKEKVNAADMADRVKDSRSAFRAAHYEEMKQPLSKEALEEKKESLQAVHKYKDDFHKINEGNMNYSMMQHEMESQLFPEGKKDIVNKATGMTIPNNRERVAILSVAHMLKKGYTMEQVLDTSNYIKDKADCAEDLKKELENCDEKRFFEIHLEYQKLLKTNIEKYAADHNISFKNPESVFGYPAVYLIELTLGSGNMADFMFGKEYKAKVAGYFGPDVEKEANTMSRNSMAIGMLPTFMAQKATMYSHLAAGAPAKGKEGDLFTNAVKAEVVMGVIGAFEKPGKVFSPEADLMQVEAVYHMIMCHPKMEKFYKESSNEKLMDLMAKGNILKELNVDFELLGEKKMPGIDLENKTLDIDLELGAQMAESCVVPTFDGSSAYYEMDTPEVIMEKARVREEERELARAQRKAAGIEDEMEEDMEM